MSSPENPRPQRAKAVPMVALMIGLIVVPATAVAAFALGGRSQTPPDTTVAGAATASAAPTAHDLTRACGPAGRKMIKAERRGALTNLQRAALDALREVCAGSGLPLPRKDEPDDVVRTAVVSPVSSATTSTTSPAGSWGDDDDSDDDHHGGDDDDHWDDHGDDD